MKTRVVSLAGGGSAVLAERTHAACIAGNTLLHTYIYLCRAEGASFRFADVCACSEQVKYVLV